MKELDLSYCLNDDMLHFAEGPVAPQRLPDYGTVASGESGGTLPQNTSQIMECESKEVSKMSKCVDDSGDAIAVEEHPRDLSTLDIAESDSSSVNNVFHPVEKHKRAILSELPKAGSESLPHILDDVVELESDKRPLLDSKYYQKSHQDLLKDAIYSQISASQFQRLPYTSLFPSRNDDFDRDRESMLSGEGMSFLSDNDELFNPILSSFNFPNCGFEAHENERPLEHSNSAEEQECAHAHRGIDVLPLDHSKEPKFFTKAMNEYTDFETSAEGVSESFSFQLKKLEEDQKRAERRIKEATIHHNDFAPLEEGTLLRMFCLPSSKSRKGSSTKRKRRSRKKNMTSKSRTDIGHELLVSLYAKDTVILSQNGKQEQEERKQTCTDLKNPEEWLCTLNSAFEIDDDILGEICFDQADTSNLLTVLENLGDVMLSNGITEPNTSKSFPATAVSPAGTMVIDVSRKLLEKTLNPPASRNSAMSVNSHKLNEKQKPETIIDLITGSPETELATSSPRRLTASLYPKHDLESRTNKQNQSRFHRGVPSVLTKDDQFVKSMGSGMVDGALGNCFISPPVKASRKHQRSFREILFEKPLLLRKSSNSENSNRKPSKVEVEDSQCDRKFGTMISLKSLWRSKLISHSTPLSPFSLESGVSLDDYVADYVGRRDLKLPKYGDVLSKDAEAVKKMILDESDPIPELYPDSRESDDSDNTLTSFVNDKLRAGDNFLLEYDPTQGPMLSKSYEVEEDKRWLGLRRFKTMSKMKRHPTIRFAQEPIYITESAKQLNLCEGETSEGTLEGYSVNHTKSILKRASTLGTQKRRFRSLFTAKA